MDKINVRLKLSKMKRRAETKILKFYRDLKFFNSIKYNLKLFNPIKYNNFKLSETYLSNTTISDTIITQ